MIYTENKSKIVIEIIFVKTKSFYRFLESFSQFTGLPLLFEKRAVWFWIYQINEVLFELRVVGIIETWTYYSLGWNPSLIHLYCVS